jgi:hypothetical protein
MHHAETHSDNVPTRPKMLQISPTLCFLLYRQAKTAIVVSLVSPHDSHIRRECARPLADAGRQDLRRTGQYDDQV